MAFNIKGWFKDRFYKQAYMSVSVLVYQAFVFYLLFSENLSGSFEWMRRLNQQVLDLFFVLAV